jgi:hypothetical protein
MQGRKQGRNICSKQVEGLPLSLPICLIKQFFHFFFSLNSSKGRNQGSSAKVLRPQLSQGEGEEEEGGSPAEGSARQPQMASTHGVGKENHLRLEGRCQQDGEGVFSATHALSLIHHGMTLEEKGWKPWRVWIVLGLLLH